ncbi:NADH-quinone oxidoreductase subunit C [Streptomyces sp. Tu 3180]|uniref:NADH-quinone oxidoreductase subunit C n=1 Tax=Streptomyces sp. Tu 3180 TaxID=2682611 RepID=UPI00135B32F5|nr:NADH-quinone oxidoreductase subunit C [Streptomyces sp. Tu 3180]
MTTVGWLPAGAEELFGPDATAEESYGVLTVDVPPASWISALETARDRIGCAFFDWLSAVDEPGTGFRVTAHVAALSPVRRLLLRTTVPHEAPALPSAVDVYAGAAWHERETHEMFGIDFTGHPALEHLLLPDGFEGHPLRKDFVLAARVAKAWPGAKEPGEPAEGAAHGGPKRRQMLPPGVPDPNEWGPLKGQLPPAPARPARGAGRAAAGAGRAAGERPAAARAAGDRPVRRMRTAAEGSASQAAEGAEGAAGRAAKARPEAPATDTGSATEPTRASEPAAPPARRARSASEGSASQRAGTRAAGGPRRARSASEGSASQRAASDRTAPPDGTEPADGTPAPVPAEDRPEREPSAVPRSPDAPWHHARPAFDRPETEDGTGAESGPARGAAPGPARKATPERPRETGPGTTPETGRATTPEAGRDTAPEAGRAPASGAGQEATASDEADREASAPDAPPGTASGTAGGSESPAPEPEPAPEGRETPDDPSAPAPPAPPGDPDSPTPDDPSGGPR